MAACSFLPPTFQRSWNHSSMPAADAWPPMAVRASFSASDDVTATGAFRKSGNLHCPGSETFR
eukprot:4805299-Prymnesium_polylepis.1